MRTIPRRNRKAALEEMRQAWGAVRNVNTIGGGCNGNEYAGDALDRLLNTLLKLSEEADSDD